jgi:6-pyruvoyltetrahydropterin/6-carboxytetrahydropterin synthase
VAGYRIARQFRVESGHRLSKHPELCRFPHGHSRVVEVVLAADGLDANDMVCDYKALKLAVGEILDRFDHAMVLAADDPLREHFAPFAERVVLIEEGDPTTEVLARHLFGRLCDALAPGREIVSASGVSYRLPPGVRVERVRVWESAATWAEYSGGPV